MLELAVGVLHDDADCARCVRSGGRRDGGRADDRDGGRIDAADRDRRVALETGPRDGQRRPAAGQARRRADSRHCRRRRVGQQARCVALDVCPHEVGDGLTWHPRLTEVENDVALTSGTQVAIAHDCPAAAGIAGAVGAQRPTVTAQFHVIAMVDGRAVAVSVGRAEVVADLVRVALQVPIEARIAGAELGRQAGAEAVSAAVVSDTILVLRVTNLGLEITHAQDAKPRDAAAQALAAEHVHGRPRD